MSTGYAIYDANTNRLEVTRPGESMTRYIPCTNLQPGQDRVFGVQVEGDDIWVLIGPMQNQRPSRKLLYKFSSLSGGSGFSI